MKIFDKVIKVKHLVVLLVLLFALKFVAHKKHKRFNHKRFAQKEWVQKRGNYRGEFRKHRRLDFSHLSKTEKASVDSLRSLMKRGDRENNMVIMKQIKGIVKK